MINLIILLTVFWLIFIYPRIFTKDIRTGSKPTCENPRPAAMPLGGGHLLYDDGVYSMGATSASVMVSPLSTRSMSREACSTVASSGYITDAVPAMVESMPPVPVTA